MMGPPGHFAIGLAARPVAPKAHLWALGAATEVPDLLFFVLQAAGIEDAGGSTTDWKMQTLRFFMRGGPIFCLRLAAGYARAASSEIEAAFSEKYQASSPPVSCAAMLAQEMGASDLHTVMAAGFAGGIGLSGSACGALGAAIWITGMNWLQENAGDDNIWKSEVFQSRAADVIARFKKCTDSKFECSKIVGRKFESVDDHAAYLRDGGCSEIIKALAA